MKLNELRDHKGATSNSKRVGRGIGSGKGKTCGSGHKGQKARTGVAINGFEGGQMPLYRRLPKRGFTSHKSQIKKVSTIDLDDINNLITKGKVKTTDILDKQKMIELGVISKNKKILLKVLGTGELKSKIKINVDMYSKSAAEKIKKAGGECV